jgi:hypothetical protein
MQLTAWFERRRRRLWPGLAAPGRQRASPGTGRGPARGTPVRMVRRGPPAQAAGPGGQSSLARHFIPCRPRRRGAGPGWSCPQSCREPDDAAAPPRDRPSARLLADDPPRPGAATPSPGDALPRPGGPRAHPHHPRQVRPRLAHLDFSRFPADGACGGTIRPVTAHGPREKWPRPHAARRRAAAGGVRGGWRAYDFRHVPVTVEQGG